ncbi:unnamed protein product [Acidithrix sp. C25]|nr:unnamed protein product [Acidithrix sp. C25]
MIRVEQIPFSIEATLMNCDLKKEVRIIDGINIFRTTLVLGDIYF